MMLRRAGAILLTLMLGAAFGAVVLTAPAMAGGWAVTVIDPAGTVEAGKAHRISFWVLQHGTHPYSGSDPAAIGTVGLMLANGGSRVTFTGTPLPEPAHYVTTVTVPHAGQWEITGVQGIFAGFHVGALSVPGTVQPLGVPAAPSVQDMQKYWPGKVQPPVLKVDRERDPFVNDLAKSDVIAAPAPANAGAGGNDTGTGAEAVSRSDSRTPILAGGLLVLLLAGLAVGGRRWFRRRDVAQT